MRASRSSSFVSLPGWWLYAGERAVVHLVLSSVHVTGGVRVYRRRLGGQERASISGFSQPGTISLEDAFISSTSYVIDVQTAPVSISDPEIR
jgi:hypothetical protein